VLVVDNEPAILRGLTRALGRDHEVLALADSREALKRFQRGETFDVVFCDLMMPFLSGDALYHRVRALIPAQAERFVFVTGGATDPRSRQFLDEVHNERVEKPFSVQNLRGIVRRFKLQPFPKGAEQSPQSA
jgi:CheY-like chemotaxis protein